MRLKKLMSLVLACAMALSLVTVASAADTEVYYIEDFSGYKAEVEGVMVNDVATFMKNVTWDTFDVPNNGANLGKIYQLTKTSPKVIYAGTTNSGVMGTAQSSFETNSFGSATFRPMTSERITAIGGSNANGRLYFVSNKAWNFTENDTETYVISYEYEPNGSAYKGGTYFDAGVLLAGDEQVGSDGSISYTSNPYILWTAGTSTAANGATTSYQFIRGNSHVNQWSNFTMNNNQAYRVALGFHYGEDSTNIKTNSSTSATYRIPTKVFAVDGVKKVDSTTEWNSNAQDGKTTFYGAMLGYGYASEEFANIKIYTIKTNDFKVYAETATNVPLNAKSMRIYFSNPVAPATYAAPVVKADGVPMEAGTYGVGELKDYVGNVGGEIYSYVDVTFDALEEGTTYTVEFPETVTNEIGTTLTGKNVATFVTKMPDVKLMPLTIVGADSLVADGSLQAVKAQLINNTSAPKNVALIYAVYAGDKLADIVYINDSVEDTTDYEVGLKLTSAGTVKAFAWDGMTSLKPYTGSQTVAIAAVAE